MNCVKKTDEKMHECASVKFNSFVQTRQLCEKFIENLSKLCNVHFMQLGSGVTRTNVVTQGKTHETFLNFLSNQVSEYTTGSCLLPGSRDFG